MVLDLSEFFTLCLQGQRNFQALAEGALTVSTSHKEKRRLRPQAMWVEAGLHGELTSHNLYMFQVMCKSCGHGCPTIASLRGSYQIAECLGLDCPVMKELLP